MQLQQVRDILDSSLAEILTIERVLTAHKATSGTVTAVRERASQNTTAGIWGLRGKCFEYGGPHMARYCTAKTPRAIWCYRCGREGHIAVYCGKGQGQGNEQGETAAPAVIRPQE